MRYALERRSGGLVGSALLAAAAVFAIANAAAGNVGRTTSVVMASTDDHQGPQQWLHSRGTSHVSRAIP